MYITQFQTFVCHIPLFQNLITNRKHLQFLETETEQLKTLLQRSLHEIRSFRELTNFLPKQKKFSMTSQVNLSKSPLYSLLLYHFHFQFSLQMKMNLGLSSTIQYVAATLLCAVLCGCSACFIRNCPAGGKRSLDTAATINTDFHSQRQVYKLSFVLKGQCQVIIIYRIFFCILVMD